MSWWSKLHIFDKAGLILFAGFLIMKMLHWTFEEQFTEDLWFTEPTKRYKIVDDLVEEKLLLGKSANEVIQLLGKPYDTETIGNDVFVYRLGIPPSFSKLEEKRLLVIFVNGIVAYVAKSSQKAP